MQLVLLQALLAEDGIHLPDAGGAEKAIKCFSPAHEDTAPSMSVNVAKGLYLCHACGIKGNAYTYLTEIRGVSPKEAMQRLEEAGMTKPQTEAFAQRNKQFKADRSGMPKPVRKPYDQMKDHDLADEYRYVNEKGGLLWLVRRYEHRTVTGKSKTFLPFTPNPDGGWWVCAPTHAGLPEASRVQKYPLYRLPDVHRIVMASRRHPDAAMPQIWVVEGEKCADAVANVQGTPKGRAPPVCSLYGGSKHKLGRHELTPLYGQKVLLLSDADKTGRGFARRLGKHLAQNGSTVRYVLPKGDSGDDVADAIVVGGGWKGVLKWIDDAGGVLDHDEVFESKSVPEPGEHLGDTPYYRVLGFTDKEILIQSKTTSQLILSRPGSLCQDGTLLHLAPMAYWKALTSNNDITPKHKTVWADAMIRAAEKKGEVSVHTKQLWKRGAARLSDGSIVYNVGDGVLVSDDDGMLNRKVPLLSEEIHDDIFLPGPKVKLLDNQHCERWSEDLYNAIMSYRWEKYVHGLCFVGWIVSALVGGALPFRPNIWLTAASNTGKTYLLSNVLRPIFGDMCILPVNTTEAGIAAATADTSLPVLLDEFEPERSQVERNEGILGLVRVATSGSGERLRGTQHGGLSLSRLRFSLLASSIDRPQLAPALANRFIMLRLSRRPVEDWPSVREAITTAVAPERTVAIRTRIIRNTQALVEKSKAIEDELIAYGIDTRSSQQQAALTAGVRFLSGNEEISLGWPEDRDADPYGPMSALMSALLPRRMGSDLTIAEAILDGYFDPPTRLGGQRRFCPDPDIRDAGQTELVKMVERHGFRMTDADTLWMAPTWPRMTDLLKHSLYSNLDLDDYIRQLPGVYLPKDKAGKRQRMTAGGMTRAVVAIPRDTLEMIGFYA